MEKVLLLSPVRQKMVAQVAPEVDLSAAEDKYHRVAVTVTTEKLEAMAATARSMMEGKKGKERKFFYEAWFYFNKVASEPA